MQLPHGHDRVLISVSARPKKRSGPSPCSHRQPGRQVPRKGRQLAPVWPVLDVLHAQVHPAVRILSLSTANSTALTRSMQVLGLER